MEEGSSVTTSLKQLDEAKREENPSAPQQTIAPLLPTESETNATSPAILEGEQRTAAEQEAESTAGSTGRQDLGKPGDETELATPQKRGIKLFAQGVAKAGMVLAGGIIGAMKNLPNIILGNKRQAVNDQPILEDHRNDDLDNEGEETAHAIVVKRNQSGAQNENSGLNAENIGPASNSSSSEATANDATSEVDESSDRSVVDGATDTTGNQTLADGEEILQGLNLVGELEKSRNDLIEFCKKHKGKFDVDMPKEEIADLILQIAQVERFLNGKKETSDGESGQLSGDIDKGLNLLQEIREELNELLSKEQATVEFSNDYEDSGTAELLSSNRVDSLTADRTDGDTATADNQTFRSGANDDQVVGQGVNSSLKTADSDTTSAVSEESKRTDADNDSRLTENEQENSGKADTRTLSLEAAKEVIELAKDTLNMKGVDSKVKLTAEEEGEDTEEEPTEAFKLMCSALYMDNSMLKEKYEEIIKAGRTIDPYLDKIRKSCTTTEERIKPLEYDFIENKVQIKLFLLDDPLKNEDKVTTQEKVITEEDLHDVYKIVYDALDMEDVDLKAEPLVEEEGKVTEEEAEKASVIIDNAFKNKDNSALAENREEIEKAGRTLIRYWRNDRPDHIKDRDKYGLMLNELFEEGFVTIRLYMHAIQERDRGGSRPLQGNKAEESKDEPTLTETDTKEGTNPGKS